MTPTKKSSTARREGGRAKKQKKPLGAPPPSRPRAAAKPVVRLSAKEATLDKFREVYGRHQVILVKGCGRSGPRGAGRVDLALLRRMYSEYGQMVRRSFFVEKAPAATTTTATPPAAASASAAGRKRAEAAAKAQIATRLLGGTRAPPGPWYASFVVQRSREAVEKLLQAMPFAVPPFLQQEATASATAKAGSAAMAKRKRGEELPAPQHSKAFWVFFGSNPSDKAMRGRAEHTDAIEHSGTWHVQVQGSKTWTLRPTTELKRRNRALGSVGRVRVHCEAGDVLCINTKLWWHQTQLPAGCALSLSIARDMYLDGTKADSPDFTNVKGHYATRVFERNEVVFTEDEAPSLELPRSNKANCKVCEVNDEGEMAVVAKRKIKPGEWFCVSESEDEEEEEEEEENE